MKHISRTAWILIGLTVLAVALRLVNIVAEPFWGDEILSFDIVTSIHKVSDLVRYLAEVEFHPPLYYLVLKGWLGIFGENELAARLLSLVFGIGLVPLVFGFGRRIFGRSRPALIAALIISVMPFLVEFSQEARPYTMLAFFLTLAAWALMERMRSPSWRLSSLYVVSVVVAAYLHYSAVFFIAPMSLWWLVEILWRKEARAQGIRSWFLVHAAIALLLMPWLETLLYKMLLGSYLIDGLPRILKPTRTGDFFGMLMSGIIWPNMKMRIEPGEILGTFIAVAAALWGALTIARRRVRMPRGLTFLVAVAVLGAVLYLFSPQSVEYADLYQRHVIFLLVPVALLSAWIVDAVGGKPGAVILALFLISFIPSLGRVLENDQKWLSYFQIVPSATHVDTYGQPGDLAISAVCGDRSNFSHYIRDDIPIVALLPVGYLYAPGVEPWSTRHTLGLIENELQLRWVNETWDQFGYGDDFGRDMMQRKLEYLIDRYQSERVWLYALQTPAVHDWFKERGWRHALRSDGNLMRLDLYVRPADNLQAL